MSGGARGGAAEPSLESHISILGVLRRNSDVRRIWLAQVVSETGDWLTRIAVTAQIANDPGRSALEIAAVQAVMIVPFFFVSPIAGVLADRLPRRSLMIASDLLSAAVVLSYLWVFRLPPSASSLALLLVAIFLHLGLAGVFEAARTSILAAAARPSELASANALTQATWSVCLALGSALGGLLLHWFGRDVAVLVDSATFLAGAAILVPVAAGRAPASSAAEPGGGFADAIRYLRAHPTTAALLLPKLFLGFVGMNDLAFALLGPRELGVSAEESFSKYFLAVGIGTFVGPVVGTHLTRGNPKKMRAAIGLAFLYESAAFLGTILAPGLDAKAAFAGAATAGGSIVWSMSAALLQRATPDRVMGRAAAIDVGNLTLAIALSLVAGGALVDHGGLRPTHLFAVTTAVYAAGGVVWLGVLRALRGRPFDGDAGRPA